MNKYFSKTVQYFSILLAAGVAVFSATYAINKLKISENSENNLETVTPAPTPMLEPTPTEVTPVVTRKPIITSTPTTQVFPKATAVPKREGNEREDTEDRFEDD